MGVPKLHCLRPSPAGRTRNEIAFVFINEEIVWWKGRDMCYKTLHRRLPSGHRFTTGTWHKLRRKYGNKILLCNTYDIQSAYQKVGSRNLPTGQGVRI